MKIQTVALTIQIERIYYKLDSQDNLYKAEYVKICLAQIAEELKHYKRLSDYDID